MASEFDEILGGGSDTEGESAADEVNPFRIVGSAANHPTVFADGCLYAVKTAGVVRLTFVETVLEAANAADPGGKTRHVGTLVMPIEGMKATMIYLNRLMSQWDEPDGE